MKLELLQVAERDYNKHCLYLVEFIRMHKGVIAKRMSLFYYKHITRRLL